MLIFGNNYLKQKTVHSSMAFYVLHMCFYATKQNILTVEQLS